LLINIVYFLSKGLAAFVLPRYENKPYITVNASDYFGHIDMAIQEDMLELDLMKEKRKKTLIRRFTLCALMSCEMFILNIEELEKLKIEFPEMFIELFNGAHRKL
jgi:hypothetical protein